MSSPTDPPPLPPGRASHSWFPWILLSVATAVVVAAIATSLRLRQRQATLHSAVEELARIETVATAQANIAWRALNYMITGEQMAFVRLRGEEGRGRAVLQERLKTLRAALVRELPETDGPEVEGSLGSVDGAATRFLSSVQGMLGQLSIARASAQKRLEHWDMNFGAFSGALKACRDRVQKQATAAARLADSVTMIAALLTLSWLAVFVWRLTRLRAKRGVELQAERLRTLEESEARFRELVRHSSDLILVVEPSGALRYATPSARRMLLPNDEAFATASDQTLDCARQIEDAIGAGAFSSAESSIEETRSLVELIFDTPLESLVANVVSEVHIDAGLTRDSARILDVHVQDLSDHESIRGIVLNARDITERKALEERLRHQALHDPLTDLPNRRRFRQAFTALPCDVRARAAVLFVDLDGFKLVNDSYGHGVGDDLLLQVASRLSTCIDDGDLLARQGGDEFLVLCAIDGTAVAAAEAMATKIRDALVPPFRVRDSEVFIQASIGMVTGIGDLDADQAVQRADIAMYAAKALGKGRAVFFEENMLAGAPERLALESDFRRALERGEFHVVYQPKVGLTSGCTESVEALVRWQHPTRGAVGPDSFIPFAEESGLIHDLGRYVLRRACEDACRWKDRGIVVAVNLSPVQFRNDALVAEIRAALEDSGLPAELLELEITESAVLGDVEKTTRVLGELKRLGIRLAIDDFGTGYSNLAHIKHYNVDVLKIDQSFVRGSNPGCNDALSDGDIVAAVIAMAKAFGLHVVAEGVESASHVAALQALGADLGQGYWFSKPVDAAAIDALLEREESREADAPEPVPTT